MTRKDWCECYQLANVFFALREWQPNEEILELDRRSVTGGIALAGKYKSVNFYVKYKENDFLRLVIGQEGKAFLGEFIPVLSPIIGADPLASFEISSIKELGENPAALDWNVSNPESHIKQLFQNTMFDDGAKVYRVRRYIKN